MNTHNNFETAAQRERRLMTLLFNQLGIERTEFTEGYTRHDFSLTASTNGEVMIGEIKVRNTKSSDYNNSTFIEEDKVKYLLDHTRGTDKKPGIVFFFSDGYAYKQMLSHDEVYPTREVRCNKTTMGDQTKIPKRMIDFNIDRTKLIRLEFNID